MLRILTAVLLIFFLFTSCKHSSNVSSHLILKTDTPAITLGSVSGSGDSVSVISNTSWTVNIPASAADWLKVNVASGNGNAAIYFSTLKENLSASSKVATVQISAVNSPGTPPATVDITQRSEGDSARTAFGGSAYDLFFCSVHTSDDGYIAVGQTSSGDGDVAFARGG